MGVNPNLHVMIQSGYYDGATTYFNAKYVMWQLNASGKLSDRLSFKGYRSGHMMYLRNEDLIKANEDLRVFIKNAPISIEKDAKHSTALRLKKRALGFIRALLLLSV